MLKKTSPEQSKDTGLALALVFLFIVFLGKNDFFLLPAIIVLILTMTWPALFGPMAKVWFGLSHFLGGIVSKIFLSIIFFIIVTPIGIIRKKKGADAMRLKQWKKSSDSVFIKREHRYSAEDLKNMY